MSSFEFVFVSVVIIITSCGPNFYGCTRDDSRLKSSQLASPGLRTDPGFPDRIGYNSRPGPVINKALSSDVVAVLGKEVRLKCHVTNIGNRTISWLRLRDLHLLTVGRYTYTTDLRFSAQHIPLTHFWQLRIRDVVHEDAGKYECQVSTTPPIGHVIDLKVVEPHTNILGGPDMHVDWGSTINLTCIARFSPAPPPDLEWFHNEKVISYDSPRGGVSVVIEKGEMTTSQLLIQRATAKDSGIYKCVPANTVEAAISLHVLQGENPDAWQTSSSTKISSPIHVYPMVNALCNILLMSKIQEIS